MGLARSFQITNIFPHLSVAGKSELGDPGAAWARARMVARDRSWQTRQSVPCELLGRLNLLCRGQMPSPGLFHTAISGDWRSVLPSPWTPSSSSWMSPRPECPSRPRRKSSTLLHQIPRAVTILLIEHDIDVVLQVVRSRDGHAPGEILAKGSRMKWSATLGFSTHISAAGPFTARETTRDPECRRASIAIMVSATCCMA